MKIGFTFRNTKDSKGRNELMMQVSLGRGKQTKISTKLSIIRKFWDNDTHRLKKEHPDALKYNHSIREYKERIEQVYNDYDNEEHFSIADARAILTGKRTKGSVDEFVERYYSKKHPPTYKAYVNKLRGFKKYAGFTKYDAKNKPIINDLQWVDINDDTIGKMRKTMKALIDKGKLSPRTYNEYASTIKNICEKAFMQGVLFKPKRFNEDLFGMAETDDDIIYPENQDILKAIDGIETIEQWQGIAFWLLMFACRGLYPADISNIKDSSLKNLKTRSASRSWNSWYGDEGLYLDHTRNKTKGNKKPRKYFIKMLPQIVMLIEKIKYTLIYTHSNKTLNGRLVISDVNSKIGLFDYDLGDTKTYEYHKNIFKQWNKQFKLINPKSIIKFMNARKSVENYARKITRDDGTRKYTDDLIQIFTARKWNTVLENSYVNYKQEDVIKQVDALHEDVLKEFSFDFLLNKLIVKLVSFADNETVPKWCLKQSAVFKKEGKYVVATGVNGNDLAKAEWVEIDKKYHKYFNDKALDEDFWIYEDEEKNDETTIVFEKPKLTDEEIKLGKLGYTGFKEAKEWIDNRKKIKQKYKKEFEELKQQNKGINKVLVEAGIEKV